MESRQWSTADGAWSVPRGFIVLLGSAGAVVLVAGLRATADLVGPIFLGLVLTVTAAPLRGRLCRTGTPPWLATLLTMLTVYLVLLGLAGALALSVARLATLLPQYGPRFTEITDQVRSHLESLGVGSDQAQSVVSSVDLDTLIGRLEDILSGLLSLSSDLLLLVTLVLFMGIDAAGFPKRLAAVGQERPAVVSALAGFARGTRRYLLVATVFGLIVAVIDSGALALLGVPLPLVWGLLAFVTNYVPNIGFVIGLIPPALLGLLDGGVGTMVAVIVTYCVINVVIQSVIQPKVVGDAVGLSATLSFVSLIFWAWVIGPLGALLAIPLSLLTKALLLEIDPTTRWIGTLVGGDVPTADPADPADPVKPAELVEPVEPAEMVELGDAAEPAGPARTAETATDR